MFCIVLHKMDYYCIIIIIYIGTLEQLRTLINGSQQMFNEEEVKVQRNRYILKFQSNVC